MEGERKDIQSDPSIGLSIICLLSWLMLKVKDCTMLKGVYEKRSNSFQMWPLTAGH